jgi:hypothetical protein
MVRDMTPPSVFPISDPRDCYLCGEPLFDRAEGRAGAHDACVHEWRGEIEARSCYVCGDLLDDDQPDGAAHASCVEGLSFDELAEVAPSFEPLRPIEDVPLPDDPWGAA